jgi:hypothetical protein
LLPLLYTSELLYEDKLHAEQQSSYEKQLDDTAHCEWWTIKLEYHWIIVLKTHIHTSVTRVSLPMAQPEEPDMFTEQQQPNDMEVCSE